IVISCHSNIARHSPRHDAHLAVGALNDEPIAIRRSIYSDVSLAVPIEVVWYRLVAAQGPLSNSNLLIRALNDEPVAIRWSEDCYICFAIAVVIRRYRDVALQAPLLNPDIGRCWMPGNVTIDDKPVAVRWPIDCD